VGKINPLKPFCKPLNDAKIFQMLKAGLVSVTYRALSPIEIVNLCVDAQLQGIEWGGDIHVPHGDVAIAREVGELTRDHGLEVVCYGSYYHCDNDASVAFEKVLESAIALQAPLIRVWAGKIDAQDAQTADFARVLVDLERISEMASEHHIGITTEYHGKTLTSNGQAARQLLDMGAGQFSSLWQPLRRTANSHAEIEENLAELDLVTPYLSNVHVYEWRDDEAGNRHAFSLDSSVQWERYIEKLKEIGDERFLLLEFVPDDAPKNLKIEAAALRRLLEA
jgi:3-dehydroshikimate dehydratase